MSYPKKGLSIDLGKDKIKIIEYKRKGDHVQVIKSSLMNTPEDCLDDGMIVDFDKITKCIADAMKEEGFKEKKVIFTVASSKVITREVELPDLPKKKLDTLIQMNAEEYFPVDLVDYTTDYRIIEHFVNGDDKMVHIDMFAAYTPLLESYVQLAVGLGLKLSGIDYSGNSLVNLATRLNRTDTFLLLNLGSDSTIITIMRGQEVRFSRRLPYGTRIILNAVESSFGLSYFESLKISEEQTLFPEVVSRNYDFSKDDMTSALGQLFSGVSRLLDFYLSRNKDELSAIILVGGGTKINDIDKKFGEYFHTEVKVASDLENVSYINQTDNKKNVYFANSVGAVFSTIDLSPRSYLNKRNDKILARRRLELIALSVVVVVGIMYLPYLSIKRLEGEKAALQTDLDEMKIVEEMKMEYELLIEQQAFYLAFDHESQSTSEIILELFELMEKKIPTEVDYIALSNTEEALVINCITNDKHTMAKFMTILKELTVNNKPVFSNVYIPEFDNPSRNTDLDGETIVVDDSEVFYSFSVTCEYLTQTEVSDEQ